MLQILGTTVEDIVTSEQAGGSYYQFVIHVPLGEGVPPHVHRAEDELLYVLDGEMTVIHDGREVVAGPGKGFAFPRDQMHGFFNRSESPARVLVTVSPGEAFERFLVELDEISRRPKLEMPAVFELAGRYGITFFGV